MQAGCLGGSPQAGVLRARRVGITSLVLVTNFPPKSRGPEKQAGFRGFGGCSGTRAQWAAERKGCGLSGHLLPQARVQRQGWTDVCRQEATHLLEPPGALWALQGGPAWLGLRVLRYWWEGCLRISLPVGYEAELRGRCPQPPEPSGLLSLSQRCP